MEGVYELHTFTDASKDAYTACAYLLFRPIHGQETITGYVFVKTRLAPPKVVSIPRLEILGVLIGKRMTEFLNDILQVHLARRNLWIDATTVFQWLHSGEILQVFVQNRITEL